MKKMKNSFVLTKEERECIFKAIDIVRDAALDFEFDKIACDCPHFDCLLDGLVTFYHTNPDFFHKKR